MKAICTDGTEIECKNFKAVEGGVLLTKDKKRKKVFGFVPNTNLAYVLPDDVVPSRSPEASVEESSTDDDSPTDDDADLHITAGADEGGEETDEDGEADEGGADDEEAEADDEEAETDDEEAETDDGREDEADDGDEASPDESGDADTDDENGEAVAAEDDKEPDGTVIDLDADPDDHAVPADADDPVAGLVSDAPDATTLDPDEDLRRLAGLGDTYADRLRAAGVETVSDLRACSVDEVVEAARVPRGRAERWLRLVTPR